MLCLPFLTGAARQLTKTAASQSIINSAQHLHFFPTTFLITNKNPRLEKYQSTSAVKTSITAASDKCHEEAKMKFLLFLLFSFSVLAAGPVDPAKLAAANKYIMEQLLLEDAIDPETDYVSLKDVNKDDNGLLDAMTIEAVVNGVGGIASIMMDETALLASAKLSTNLDVFDMDPEILLELAEMVPVLAENYPGFNIKFDLTTEGTKHEGVFVITPVEGNDIALNSLKVTVMMDTADNGLIMGQAEADMTPSHEIVQKGQKALTNIFEATAAGQEPSSE